MTVANRIRELLKPFRQAKKAIVPASENLLAEFCRRVSQRGVPDSVVGQLVEFYKISNGTPCLNGFGFHRCEDEILFEWWESDRELWLGQRDCDMLRWSAGKFCLGDAGNVSYGHEYEFSALVDLLEAAYKDWEFITDEENEKLRNKSGVKGILLSSIKTQNLISFNST